MQKKDACLKVIKIFRAKHGLEASDEKIISTNHLKNTYGFDANSALDQCSRGKNDHGVDAWHYDELNKEPFVYQSRQTESKTFALMGFDDLDSARQRLEQIIIEGTINTMPSDNHC